MGEIERRAAYLPVSTELLTDHVPLSRELLDAALRGDLPETVPELVMEPATPPPTAPPYEQGWIDCREAIGHKLDQAAADHDRNAAGQKTAITAAYRASARIARATIQRNQREHG